EGRRRRAASSRPTQRHRAIARGSSKNRRKPMSILLTNAILMDTDPIRIEPGSLRIEGDRIVARGSAQAQSGDEIIDCGGAVVMPGMVNGHTHLYSTMAVGMPPPPRNPANFLEILQLVWWKLDEALDAESIEMSARIGAI